MESLVSDRWGSNGFDGLDSDACVELAMAVLLAVSFSSLELEDDDLLGPALCQDLGSHADVLQERFSHADLLAVLQKENLVQNDLVPRRTPVFSIRSVSPSVTRYCFPPC